MRVKVSTSIDVVRCRAATFRENTYPDSGGLRRRILPAGRAKHRPALARASAAVWRWSRAASAACRTPPPPVAETALSSLRRPERMSSRLSPVRRRNASVLDRYRLDGTASSNHARGGARSCTSQACRPQYSRVGCRAISERPQERNPGGAPAARTPSVEMNILGQSRTRSARELFRTDRAP